jgi:hypothetical protein
MSHLRISFLVPFVVVAAFFAPSTLQAAEPEPLFSRHIVPLFSRLGCNAGVCHGAVKGQGGFRLTLFGADAALDHERLLRDSGGRRVSLVEPAASLFLLKATASVAHQGGKRLDVGSPEYQLLLRWVAAGARLDRPEQGRIASLSVNPASRTLKPGASSAFRVEAAFADGASEDVTKFCVFETRDRTVADVDRDGVVRATGVGDTIVIVRYRGEATLGQVLVPGEPKGDFPQVKANNFIDEHVLAKLRRLDIHPAELCDDATFLRRASIDATGTLPTPDEIRAFLEDKSADKRSKKIEELLARPGYAALWATKFCDLLRPGSFDPKSGLAEAPSTRRFYEWLRTRLADNTPYDELTERILLASSREGRSAKDWIEEVRTMAAEDAAKTPELVAYAGRRTLDLYWQRQNSGGVKGTLQVAHTFLGLRLECAQCHRHPADVWQQDDLLSFANFFMRVTGSGGATASTEVVQAADEITKEVKELRDEAKKLGEKAKDKSLPKEETTQIQKELKELNDKAKALEDTGKRLKATEVHTASKMTFASVTSTLGTQKSDKFRLLGDKKAAEVAADQDPRQVVMAWLRRPDNPYFARAIVNRVWAHYFGRGIIDPPDQLSAFNPPSHPELLQKLAEGFITNKYDLKWLHRTILGSRTYQQSAQTNATSRTDTVNYASFYPRRLPAEVLVDAVNHATAGGETYPPELYLPNRARAMEVAGGTNGSANTAASLQYAFHIFGRPLRSSDVQCDCERSTSATVVQTLYLANHPRVQAKIAAPEGRVAQIVKAIDDDGKRVDEVFLWALGRLPTETDRATCLKYLKESASPQKGLEDVMWSLLNTREFILNH